MPVDKPEPKAPFDVPPNGPNYSFPGYWPPPPFPAFGTPFWGMPFAPPFGMLPPGMTPYAASNTAMPGCAAGFEAMRQFFMSRAEFWSHMMRAIADIATHAAGIAAEVHRASAMLGPGGPYEQASVADVDLEKLKQSLQSLDKGQAAKILYAVQLVQWMETSRRSPPTEGPAAGPPGC
jgi:hypothetical protein